ncbi:MAG: hypothetical protein ACKPKO_13830 [Candidatus Fonsibacter sp.]
MSEMTVVLATKAAIVYVDSQLALKANQLTTYTNTEVDTTLGLKASQSTAYTQTELDGLVSPR